MLNFHTWLFPRSSSSSADGSIDFFSPLPSTATVCECAQAASQKMPLPKKRTMLTIFVPPFIMTPMSFCLLKSSPSLGRNLTRLAAISTESIATRDRITAESLIGGTPSNAQSEDTSVRARAARGTGNRSVVGIGGAVGDTGAVVANPGHDSAGHLVVVLVGLDREAAGAAVVVLEECDGCVAVGGREAGGLAAQGDRSRGRCGGDSGASGGEGAEGSAVREAGDGTGEAQSTNSIQDGEGGESVLAHDLDVDD